MTRAWPYRGGYDFAETWRAPAHASSVFWRAEDHPMVLPVEAHDGTPVDPRDAFDLLNIPQPITVLRSVDGEHVLIADGPRSIRLDVVEGSLLSGPVRLAYRLSGFRSAEAKVMTLRRFLALERLGRLPHALFPPERRARRWALILQAHDGAAAGASHREIATALFGRSLVLEDWNGGYLRTRVQRLLRGAERMIGGGYRALLQ